MVEQIILVSEQRLGVDVIDETVRNNISYLANFKLSPVENQIKIIDYYVTPVEIDQFSGKILFCETIFLFAVIGAIKLTAERKI